MANLVDSLSNMRRLDELARQETSIHRIHPLMKLLTTVVYLTVVVSFGRDEISGLLPFVFYPALLFALAEIPVVPILKMLLVVEPFLIGIGLLNPLFEHSKMIVYGIAVSKGWFTSLSIVLKGSLTVTAGLLLIATTGMDRLAKALRMLKVPKLFVLQLLLTYRYITVLVGEVFRMLTAYSLRAPGQKGIPWRLWGSFAGQLLIRAFERAQRVYQAMVLRGFAGEYPTGEIPMPGFRDFAYFAAWSLFFVLARIFNIPMIIGSWIAGAGG